MCLSFHCNHVDVSTETCLKNVVNFKYAPKISQNSTYSTHLYFIYTMHLVPYLESITC